MPKIKHIALSTQDVEGTARFYIEVFGMKKMGSIDDPGTVGCFLSDGDINLAILNFHHIGFEVESLEAIFDKLAAAGAERRHDVEQALGVGHDHRPNVEVKFRGPDGIMLDVSETGWVGTSGVGP